MAQRSAEAFVEALPKGVGCYLRSQAGEQATQSLCPVTFQGEEVLELRDDLLDELALSRRPAAIGLRPSPQGVALRSGHHQRPVDLQPASLPADRGEALVGQVGAVAILGYEGIADGTLVAVGGARPKALTTPAGSTTRATLNP